MTEAIGGNAKEEIKRYVERVERLEEEKRGLAQDVRDIFKEAKGHGFDVKALRAAIKLRAMDKQERIEQQEVLDTYCHALGIEW